MSDLKFPSYGTSFNPHNNLMKQVQLLSQSAHEKIGAQRS